MADKEVFDVSKLDFAEFAKSLGLISAPTIKIQEVRHINTILALYMELMRGLNFFLLSGQESRQKQSHPEREDEANGATVG
jgi:hypothetical protein